MSENELDTDLAALPPPPRRRRRIGTGAKVAIALGLVVVIIGGFFLARGLYWAFRPTPEFPSLATSPDPSLSGTVAFLKPNDSRCIYIVPASGGEPRKLACEDRLGGELTWRDDGRLQSTAYPSADSDDEPASWIIDPTTGELETVPAAEIPPQPEEQENRNTPGPNGETVTCKTARGELTLTLTTDTSTRTLLSTEAPSTYCMGGATWNGDGSWFIVKDDLDRLLLVTTDDPSTTRVLVDGGYWPAVTDADLAEG